MPPARATFIEINDDARWNPWVHKDRASEERSALAVMEQWRRAEPGFRQTTDQELKEMLDEVGRRRDAQFAADAARQERAKERYDPEREQARLSLLEQESDPQRSLRTPSRPDARPVGSARQGPPTKGKHDLPRRRH